MEVISIMKYEYKGQEYDEDEMRQDVVGASNGLLLLASIFILVVIGGALWYIFG